MSEVRPQPRPWPLKWIALVIVLVIVPYTILTLKYRKPGKAFEPYHDMKQRANVVRLLSAGYQRVSLVAELPADPVNLGAGASTSSAPGGLPDSLRDTLLERPFLPSEIAGVTAPARTNSLLPCAIAVTCVMPDIQHQFGGAELYVRKDEIVITPELESLDRPLLSRSKEKKLLLTVPPGTLKPGTYRVTVVGERSSRSWTMQVH